MPRSHAVNDGNRRVYDARSDLIRACRSPPVTSDGPSRDLRPSLSAAIAATGVRARVAGIKLSASRTIPAISPKIARGP